MKKIITELNLFFKEILSETEFAGKTYFVGGCVRDFYRDLNPHDIDIVVNMNSGAEKLSHFIYEKFKNLIPKFVDTVITKPFQLGHYPIYSITFKDNFTYKGYFYLFKNLTLEIADTMDESFPDENSRQREIVFSSLENDILRRDFSINSGLIDVISFEFFDLGSGHILSDIASGVIKANKNEYTFIDKIFSNDPLRILRGIVFAARFNFTIDDLVKRVMIENSNRLKIVSRERINAEIKKAMDVEGGVYRLVNLINEIGLLDIVFPGINRLKQIYQVNMNDDGTFTYDIRKIHMEGKTVFDHTMSVLRFTKKGYINGLAAIYHDVGKIYPEYKNGKIRFINHEYIGSKIISKLFPEMKIDNDTTKAVEFLVSKHMLLHLLKDYSKKSLRRFIREIPSDELRFMLYDLCNADCLGTTSEVNGILTVGKPHYEAMELIENLIVEDSIIVEKPFRYFNGNEIMEFLNIQGKSVGDAIKIMLKIQDEYGFNEDPEIIKTELINRFFKKYPQLKRKVKK